MKIDPQTYKRLPPAQLLPSADSALALARGEPGAAFGVLAHLGVRTALIAPCAIAAGGAMGVSPGRAVGIAFACAVGIEIAVLALAFRQVAAEREALAQSDRGGPPQLEVLQGGAAD